LLTRLAAWYDHWIDLVTAIRRDCCVLPSWPVQPWAFIPEALDDTLKRGLASMTARPGGPQAMPPPLIMHLEEVVPWKYRGWDRKLEALEDEA